MPEISNIAIEQIFWADPNDWHNHAPAELREYIFQRVIATLHNRTLDESASMLYLTDEKMSELVELAKWIESQSFILGTSRTDYYRLLGVELDKSPAELNAHFKQYKETQKKNLYLIEHPITKSWHPLFSSNLRKIIISTFVEEIVPECDRISLHEKSKERLLMFASRSEVIAYETATSRAEYYQLLGKKISEVKHKIDSLMQQSRGARSAGFTSAAIDMVSQPGTSNDQHPY